MRRFSGKRERNSHLFDGGRQLNHARAHELRQTLPLQHSLQRDGRADGIMVGLLHHKEHALRFRRSQLAKFLQISPEPGRDDNKERHARQANCSDIRADGRLSSARALAKRNDNHQHGEEYQRIVSGEIGQADQRSAKREVTPEAVLQSSIE